MRPLTDAALRDIAARLPSSPRVVAAGNLATPTAALELIAATLPKFVLHMLNAGKDIPNRPGITYETTFVGPGMRDSPNLHYLPCRLSLVPVLLTRRLPVDMVILHTTSPVGGKVSLGTEVNILPGVVDAVKARGGIVVAQMNEHMPYTIGDAELPSSAVDYYVESDVPLAEQPNLAPEELAEEIGNRVADFITDGSTLQLGIGSIPNAVLHFMRDRRQLRLWTETISAGLLELVRGGCLDDTAPITTSFVAGNRELYEFVDRNEQVHVRRTEVVNDPSRIAQQTKMTSVNSAIEVDLAAQANASRIGGRIYSGFGGSTDFIVGAMHAPQGNAILALPSWHPKAQTFTVVPVITEPVTSFQHSAIITEQGVAELFGHTEEEQAQNIIGQAAHPSSRDDLTLMARQLGRIHA